VSCFQPASFSKRICTYTDSLCVFFYLAAASKPERREEGQYPRVQVSSVPGLAWDGVEGRVCRNSSERSGCAVCCAPPSPPANWALKYLHHFDFYARKWPYPVYVFSVQVCGLKGQNQLHIVLHWADIQRRGSILAWVVILSVQGADTIAEVKLMISPFLR